MMNKMETILEYKHRSGENVAMLINKNDDDSRGIRILYADNQWMVLIPWKLHDHVRATKVESKFYHVARTLVSDAIAHPEPYL
jgi:hypothetical protein